MNFILFFILLSVINVVFSTIKSLTTIKSGKMLASLISGGYYAFYNIVLIYTVYDFPMWQKCVITFFCNIIGVYVVKLTEEKMRKDRLWKIEMTVREHHTKEMHNALKQYNIPHNYIDNMGSHSLFMCYAETQEQSIIIKNIGNEFGAKYFVSETKIL